jgi:hypothetical protein
MPGAIPPLSQYAFMAWCSVKKHTGTNLPLLLPLSICKSNKIRRELRNICKTSVLKPEGR